MRRIIVSEFVTLDGVMEAPGGEPTHPHTGWVGEFFDDAIGQRKLREVEEADAHLLGRVTYESFAGAWPTYEGPMAERMNSFPKHVVSTTMTTAEWTNSHVVRSLEEVAALEGELLVAGSCRLVHSLLAADLVDELRLMVFPVSIGAGLRVFPDERVKRPWRRVDSAEFATGVRLDTYHRA